MFERIFTLLTELFELLLVLVSCEVLFMEGSEPRLLVVVLGEGLTLMGGSMEVFVMEGTLVELVLGIVVLLGGLLIGFWFVFIPFT